ncbi:MAG TPA: response regulator transcription factor [Bacteroidales bacterium]|jgi:DNA-binding NarL/FixJ family response regulator|nr:response regulator transcription factor [Bacteroidales bacterium]HNV96344.1 response regulator transcription factor [Bacteroidales bacterium]HOU99045.1 response regulator transcription factor [Bacteroidales bacterium]
MNKVNVFLVDDHDIFRKGLKLLLQEIPFLNIVGEASYGDEFLKKLQEVKPEVVFMDIKMPGINGIETTKRALESNPDLKIIALSMFGDEEHLQAMLDAGAKGFLLKNASKEDLERSIITVMNGKNYFSEELISLLASLYITQKQLKETEKEIPTFSERELEILELICKGYTSVEIGEMLGISNRTVDGHRAFMMEKMGAKNTVQLVTFAIKNKLVNIY